MDGKDEPHSGVLWTLVIHTHVDTLGTSLLRLTTHQGFMTVLHLT